jgi:o-succinylbenzoate synthase
MNYKDLTLHWEKHTLSFIQSAKTSRNVLYERDVWFIVLKSRKSGKRGIGECAPLRGLSVDYVDLIEKKITEISENLWNFLPNPYLSLKDYPSLAFALEMAFRDLQSQQKLILYPSAFTSGKAAIKINGLIWMGNFDFMLQQIEQKLLQGYNCIKIKVGGIEFSQELELLQHIRKQFTSDQLELRLDANGAFEPSAALSILNRFSEFDLHSIEQPIKAGMLSELKELCQKSPVPIALDEELIRISGKEAYKKLLQEVKPDYLVLKPSLLGGFAVCEDLIELAKENGIKFWVTSSLESNIGLNAIAQWTYHIGCQGNQGLGTGELYSNNIPSPLSQKNGDLRYLPERKWDFSKIVSL